MDFFGMALNRGKGVDTVILADNSRALTSNQLNEIKEAIIQFIYINQELSERYEFPKDNLALVTYADEPELEVPFTTMYENLAHKVADIETITTRPKIGEALQFSSRLCSKLGATTEYRGNKFLPRIILFGSGEDFSADASDPKDAAIECALQGFMVYVVHVTQIGSSDRVLLREIAKLSGSNILVKTSDLEELDPMYKRQVEILGKGGPSSSGETTLMNMLLGAGVDALAGALAEAIMEGSQDSETLPGTSSTARKFQVGQRVRVKSCVRKPKYGWGNFKKGDGGVVVGYDSDGDVQVRSPSQDRWAGTEEELEVVSSAESSGHRQFQRGDKVKVKDQVRKPKYGWGVVDPEDVGTFVRYDGDDGDVVINFPSKSGWRGVESEIERVKANEMSYERSSRNRGKGCIIQ
eukprot:TRINITY_DN3059_c0_g2_i1.p1 TRINITY_DN3059_c0_g2~~TRINITY_DN3059_c0_g2_i1.p1  ORF type:complete len:409 (+),score=51.15 TRINITY_DN3059_c0_g2_i1:130-1356(+)